MTCLQAALLSKLLEAETSFSYSVQHNACNLLVL